MSEYKKFENKKPIELTEEEIYELVKDIALIEYARNPMAGRYQSAEDGAIEFLTYAYEKDSRGKKGMSYLKSLPMKYFINMVHFEIKNGINYNLRKKPIKRALYETDSLEEPINYMDSREIARGTTIPDERYIEEIEIKTDLDCIIKNIEDIGNDEVYIKINGSIHDFSYKNLAKLYFDLSDNKKLNCTDFRGLLFSKETHEELDDKVVSRLLRKFKRYIIKNNILGGVI